MAILLHRIHPSGDSCSSSTLEGEASVELNVPRNPVLDSAQFITEVCLIFSSSAGCLIYGWHAREPTL